MQAGAHTYWKQPGDAGVPPVFSFNGSENVAAAEVLFPTPIRISEDGLEAFGYRGEVVFPVKVTPKDASRPSTLKLDMTYAICEKICVPGHATTALNLPPRDTAKDAGKIDKALLDVPVPMPADERTSATLSPVKGTPKQSWTVTWSGKEPVTDLFAEAPEGYYFETKKSGPNRFTLTAAQVVTAAKTTAVPISLVLAFAQRGLVVNETLDVTGTTN